MMKVIFYICFAIALYTIVSFLFDNGNEILQVTASTGIRLSNEMPILMPIVAIILGINAVILAMKIIYSGGLNR